MRLCQGMPWSQMLARGRCRRGKDFILKGRKKHLLYTEYARSMIHKIYATVGLSSPQLDKRKISSEPIGVSNVMTE